MSNTIKAVEKSGLDAKKALAEELLPKELKDIIAVGTFGDDLIEPVPEYIGTASEVIFKNKNNAWIVLGRDRPRGIASGFGGAGETQAASIDLVTGRHAGLHFPPQDGKYVDPDFRNDAARIYISQKTDIDDNFNLTSGMMGASYIKSGIGIKADGVRIIGREGIKLVTNTDTVNSTNAEIKSVGNIEFICGNNGEALEPLVKGDQLVFTLNGIMNQLAALTDNFNKFLQSQMAFNYTVSKHTHQCTGPWGAPKALMTDLEMISGNARAAQNQAADQVPNTIKGVLNKGSLKSDALVKGGKHYILSSNVFTT